MKKIVSLLLVSVFMLSLCACGVSLTKEQENCCEEADELFSSMAKELDLEFDREIKKEDGNILYVVTLDFDGTLNDSNGRTFQQYVLPVAESILGEEDIYVVLYLNQNGEEAYRIIDSKLDPDILD